MARETSVNSACQIANLGQLFEQDAVPLFLVLVLPVAVGVRRRPAHRLLHFPSEFTAPASGGGARRLSCSLSLSLWSSSCSSGREYADSTTVFAAMLATVGRRIQRKGEPDRHVDIGKEVMDIGTFARCMPIANAAPKISLTIAVAERSCGDAKNTGEQLRRRRHAPPKWMPAPSHAATRAHCPPRDMLPGCAAFQDGDAEPAFPWPRPCMLESARPRVRCRRGAPPAAEVQSEKPRAGRRDPDGTRCARRGRRDRRCWPL